MSDGSVHYEVSNRVARILLDRPPVNALTVDLTRAIVSALRQAAQDDEARAVVVSSAVARRFSAGLDLSLLLGKSVQEIRPFLDELYINLYDAQHDLGKPSIAAVGGAARGGGMTLAISCDVIVAAETATFGYPEIDVGVLPAIHFIHLPKIVGRYRAFELLFSGRSFGATEACALGLVSRVVADADLDRAAMALAAAFAAKSPDVVRLGRAAFRRENDVDHRRRIASAVEDFCNVAASDAGQEGLRAFVEKRPPRW